MDDPVTTDLKDYGESDLIELSTLIRSMTQKDTTMSAAAKSVYAQANDWRPYYNKKSGKVFLSNEDSYEVLVLNHGLVISGYTEIAWFVVCRDCGNEDMEHEFSASGDCAGCAEQIQQLKEFRN